MLDDREYSPEDHKNNEDPRVKNEAGSAESLKERVDEEEGWGLTREQFDARIGRSVWQGLGPLIELLSETCMIREPAEILHVSFSRNSAQISIRWPFKPPRISDYQEWFTSDRVVRDFLSEFRLYMLEQHNGRKLANLFSNDFFGFLYRYFRVHRFADFKVGRSEVKRAATDLEKPATLEKEFKALRNRTQSRRLAGARKLIIPARRATEIRRLGRKVIKIILEMQRDLASWVRAAETGHKEVTTAQLKAQVLRKYYTDQNEWMRLFWRCFRRLKLKRNYSGPESRPTLGRPKSWSAVDLARLIVGQWYIAEKGLRLSAADRKRLVQVS